MATLMAALWLRQVKTRNANAVDAAWALGFSGCAIIGLLTLFQGQIFWRPVLILACVVIWSLRLGTYLLTTRVFSKKNEDGRYNRLRTDQNWGQGSFFMMYQFQALLVVALSTAIFTAMGQIESSWRAWDTIGICVWLMAIFGESIADRQLHRFLKAPANKGKTCQIGLWKYSRHPNYFCEWLHWWAYVFFAINTDNFVLSLIGPLLMYWFLIKITGIPATERQACKSRSDYAEYQRCTSSFIPWFRKC